MTYWLLKSEPDEFSIADLHQKSVAPWDGVRNYQARNYMRDMKPGDCAFFYHSSCKEIGIAGIMTVHSQPYPDPLAIDPNSAYYDPKSLASNKWVAVDMKHTQTFKRILKLEKIKALALVDERLSDFPLIKKGNRLSVMPVSDDQWRCLIEACGVI